MPRLPLDMSTNVGKKCGLLIKQTQTARQLPGPQKKTDLDYDFQT